MRLELTSEEIEILKNFLNRRNLKKLMKKDLDTQLIVLSNLLNKEKMLKRLGNPTLFFILAGLWAVIFISGAKRGLVAPLMVICFTWTGITAPKREKRYLENYDFVRSVYDRAIELKEI